MRSFAIALVFSIVLASSSGLAAILDVDPVNNRLLGASGVLVDGQEFNIQFLDGTCADVYGACNQPMLFQSEAAALAASQAVLDQVIAYDPAVHDGFYNSAVNPDNDPTLINGCSGGQNRCALQTVWRLSWRAGENGMVQAWNYSLSDGRTDSVLGGLAQPTNDTSESGPGDYPAARQVFVVWTPVPEPSTALLMSLGLAGLASRRR